ncbi:DNA-protecting protein DprA [Candidatus Gottesmanbacteria bacterium]|nr:DNA-protecting protein DprA [Candidatus Gottesmanbacteria bacterium]
MITVSLEDKIYPPLLKEIQSPPKRLYINTKIDINKLFKTKAIAVIGTRNITAYGRQVTQKITKELVKRGFIIVSGLARGIDYIAHQTALKEGGLTIAVLGCGLDRIYPAEHARLAAEIIKNGALVTEFPLHTQITRQNFPIRNRIISGLSQGVVICEAAEKSGTMITASFAADQGREVFAIPGPITSPTSSGVSALLKKGAKLVTNVDDILEELPDY